MNSFTLKCNNFLHNFYGVNDRVQKLNFFFDLFGYFKHVYFKFKTTSGYF